MDNLIFSHDLLRINCKKPSDAGYVYAYLKSKVGNKILLTNSYGAVITHIEPEHLATVPIPDAPDALKLKIGNLVIRSYTLRDESNTLIDEATKLLIEELKLPAIDNFEVDCFKKDAPVETFNVKLSEMNYRLEASYHVPIVDAIVKHFEKYAAEVTIIGDKRISNNVFLPGRFKRVYVDEGYGRVFFGGKQLFELDPTNTKYLSISKHDKRMKEELELKENLILITRSGTIGKTVLVPKHWEIGLQAKTYCALLLQAQKWQDIFTFICYQTMVQNLSIAAHTVPSYHILMIHISTIYLCLCLKILRFNRKSIPLLLRLTKNVMRLIS